MARLDRHLGGPRRAKSSSKGGSRNGTEKVIEKGSQNDGFWEVKKLKKYCKVLQNTGFEGYGKVSNMEPLAALGRPRVDFATPGVDFEGSQKWVDF